MFKTAILEAKGTTSLRICRRLAMNSASKRLTPVMLPPGCARFVTNPIPTASTASKTIGIVAVAARTARATGPVEATMTLGIAPDDLAREIGMARRTAFARISLDCQVLSLDIAQPAQLLKERLVEAASHGVAGHFADAGDRATGHDDCNSVLLRPFQRRCRWCSGRNQQTDREIAPFHSITSSARASRRGGIVRPSALAAFRLMTSSNLVGCSTGKSSGLAPLRILSTYPAARRTISEILLP